MRCCQPSSTSAQGKTPQLDRTPSNADDSKCQLKWQKEFVSVAQQWLKYAIAKCDTLTMKHKDDHLDQALLYKDDALEVLLHRFDNTGVQSYLHNHKATFLSLCLSGTYTESKWAVCHDLDGSYIEYCRGHDGKLGEPSIQPGGLLLLKSIVFSTGQAKITHHSEIHSIRSTHENTPVTLVIRQKDTAAKTRKTACFMIDNDTTAAYRSEDRPCLESERLSMLLVLEKIARQFQCAEGGIMSDRSPFCNIDHATLVMRTHVISQAALSG
ncbi:TPA: hypothetical protein ACH3X1_000534 [Trebouxia sp. C0004]